MDPALAIKLTYIFAWLNIIGLLLVLLSCRCVFKINLGNFGRSKFFQKFYRYHCYYWWFFIISVLCHAILAITTYGNPFF